MTVDRFTLHLHETSSPPGEIALADLAAISGRLQELTTRVGRWVAEIDRPGRSTAVVEDATTLRLSGLTEGSTVLEINRGPAGRLDFDTPLEESVASRLWETMAAIGQDAPPPAAPDGIKESAVALLDALTRAAGQVEFSRPDGARVTFRPAERDRTVWAVQPPAAEERLVTVTGVVEMVDLRSHRFRLRDDVGNRIPLHDIKDDSTAGRLVGERAEARGHPVLDVHGRLVAVNEATVTPSTVPSTWVSGVRDDSWTDVERYPGPDPEGGVEFTDEEWESFLTAVKGD
jgi:hypothetical protein